MKYFTVGLLLIVCFFGGMTYGSVETNHALSQQEVQEEQETMEMEPYTEEDLKTETANIDEDVPIINQAASVLEKIVLSVYTSFISFMYHIADLFF